MRARRGGVALVLAAGLLALLAALVSALTGAARLASAGAAARLGRINAAIAAGSGLEDAAARLSLWFPGQPSGEPFSAFDAEGRFPEVARRLRGSLSIAIRAECPEGRLPLNAGALWAEDLFGYGGGPDHRDATITCHRGLVHALNNLGAIRIPPEGTRRWEAASGATGQGERFQFSLLGQDLIGNRPIGGYRSAGDVEETLIRLGYAPEECAAVLPYLDAEAPLPLPDTARLLASLAPSEERQCADPSLFPRYAPVNAHAASAVVLESLWRYLFAAVGATVRIPGEAAGWSAPCRRTDGLSFAELGPPGSAPTGGVHVLLYADEAQALADAFVSLRGQGPLSWEGIAREFSVRAADPVVTPFRSDHADLAGFPVLQQAWVQAKMDLAFQAVALDRHPPDLERLGPIPATWLGRGIDRFPDDRFDGQALPAYPGCQQYAICDPEEVRMLLYPPAGGGWGGPHVPYQAYGGAMATWGLTLAPPRRFSVEARGGCGPDAGTELRGVLLAGDRLEFACQEDFGALQGGDALAPWGISIASPAACGIQLGDLRPDGSTPVYEGGVRRAYPRVARLPREEIRGATVSTWGAPLWGFSRSQGALALAGVEAGLAGAKLYWPISEDADGVFNNGNVRQPGPGADTWHETASSFLGNDPLDPLRATVSPVPASPYWIDAGSILQTFLWPGMEGRAEGEKMRDFAVELRMGPRSKLVMKTPLESGGRRQEIVLETFRGAREENDTDLPGTRLSLAFRDRSWQGSSGTAGFFLADMDDPDPFHHHALLHVSVGANATVFRLYVDGKLLAPEGGGQKVVHPRPFTACDTSDPQKRGLIDATRADEIRIHEGPLPDVALLAGTDRFVRSGTYVSPLYAFDAPARMRQVQWTGIVPPGFPPTSLAVVVEGFSDAAGTSPVFQVPLAPSGPPEALPSGAIRSFRYRVLFDVPASVPAPLVDTPVFESIWFAFHPAGGGRWTAFEDQ